MIRFFIACGAAILAHCNQAEAADAAATLTQAERSAGYTVVLLDDDGSEVEIVGDFDLLPEPRRIAPANARPDVYYFDRALYRA